MLVNIGARSSRTLDAVDVDTLTDVAKLRHHPGHSLLRLIVVGGDVLEGRTSDENQLITINNKKYVFFFSFFVFFFPLRKTFLFEF